MGRQKICRMSVTVSIHNGSSSCYNALAVETGKQINGWSWGGFYFLFVLPAFIASLQLSNIKIGGPCDLKVCQSCEIQWV